jgi:hypothetical protein
MNRSGRPRSSDRLLAEECATLRAPKRSGRLANRWPSRVFATATWPDGSQLSRLIEITTTEMPTGGERAWFLCPGCRRRCGCLYLVEDQPHGFRCRLCLGLAYHIQYRRGPRAELLRMVRKWRAIAPNRGQAVS